MHVLDSFGILAKLVQVVALVHESAIQLLIEVVGGNVHVYGAVQARNELVQQSLLRARISGVNALSGDSIE